MGALVIGFLLSNLFPGRSFARYSDLGILVFCLFVGFAGWHVLQRRREDGNPGARGDREMPVGAGDGEGPLVVAQTNVALFEDFSILVPQDGE